MALSVNNDEELREFVRQELRRSDLATLVRQLQGLRIVYGCITPAGTVLFDFDTATLKYGGSLQSVAHNATGKWTVTLARPFRDSAYVTLLTPLAIVSGLESAVLRNDVPYTPSQFGVFTGNGGAFLDVEFMFICVGPA